MLRSQAKDAGVAEESKQRTEGLRRRAKGGSFLPSLYSLLSVKSVLLRGIGAQTRGGGGSCLIGTVPRVPLAPGQPAELCYSQAPLLVEGQIVLSNLTRNDRYCLLVPQCNERRDRDWRRLERYSWVKQNLSRVKRKLGF